MDQLRLHFCSSDQPELALPAGEHLLGRGGNGNGNDDADRGIGPVQAADAALLRLCIDRRGIWMSVAEAGAGVHVNGRPVRQLAWLRAGDTIHVGGEELQLRGIAAPAAPRDAGHATAKSQGSARFVLRGVGGPCHGRSINLDRPCLIGSSADADLRLCTPGVEAEHALVDLDQTAAVLIASADVRVNGEPVRRARLLPGDQLQLGTVHRFVLEGPPPGLEQPARRSLPPEDAPPTGASPHWSSRVPWLLVAAIALAGGLAALLALGTG